MTKLRTAHPCAWCSSPVVREFPDDEDPLYPGQECGTCNEVFHKGYDAGQRIGFKSAVTFWRAGEWEDRS